MRPARTGASRTGRVLAVAASLALAGLLGCGGGGGGGGGGSAPPADPDGSGPVAPGSFVTFLGFEFRYGEGASQTTTSIPPLEDFGAAPPTFGAPLNVAVIFKFSGVPQGPFSQSNLPVFTTPAEVTAEAMAPSELSMIFAKGTYVPVGNTVEFRPFVPTAELAIPLSSPPASVPGLLPDSLYTARVESSASLKVPNLTGAGGEVKFGTTSNEFSYYPTDGSADPPVLVGLQPPDGTLGFYPNPFANVPPGGTAGVHDTYPPGPDSLLLSFDRQLQPGKNVTGSDWDGDGMVDPTFFLRFRDSFLLLSHTVPAQVFNGTHAAFDALSVRTEGQAPSVAGSEVFVHNSQGAGAFPGGTADLPSLPVAMTIARDPSLLFAVFDGGANPDRLGVLDHVLGDPSHAKIGIATLPIGGLTGLRGLTALLDGRLVAYDTVERRIFELMPTVERARLTGMPGALDGAPMLTALDVGDGTDGFRSEVFPAGIEVLDIAQAPSGDIYALVTDSGIPALARLNPIDHDLNGSFAADDGLPGASAIVVYYADEYAALEFVSESQFYALNRTQDRVDRLSLDGGAPVVVMPSLAGFGSLGPGDASPAVAMALGHLELDVLASLEANLPTGSVVRLRPSGPLPPGRSFDVMMRPTLASLSGVSDSNADPAEPLYVLGSRRIGGATTSPAVAPLDECFTPSATVTDVFSETFLSKSFEEAAGTSLGLKAQWADTVAGGLPSGHLRAGFVGGENPQLGDFLPTALPDFVVGQAYGQNPLQANYRYIFLNTDAQNFPLPSGATPGITQPITVFNGDFVFRDFIIPEGVWVIARGSRPLIITATRTIRIDGVLDVSGASAVDDTIFDSAFFPLNGGAGGPGAGRGGDGHPTVLPPPPAVQTQDQFATPERGETGYGPVVSSTGFVAMQKVGGVGGLSSIGADFNDAGFPKVASASNTEYTRPPGGGGGSFSFHGMDAHTGAGSYLVQSESSFGNLFQCLGNDKISYALYGNEENLVQGKAPSYPLQCVYLLGTVSNPVRILPGGAQGQTPFADGDPSNDFIGPTGEIQVLIGGQGGGAGGSRIDSMNHSHWAANRLGAPIFPPPLPPPHYPTLWLGGNSFLSPTAYDARGGAGGGGGGAVQLRSYGDILISRTGRIDASGGDGSGGEVIGHSNYSGGGGGGSGGAILLEAAKDISIHADTNHLTPYFQDANMAMGAGLDVSGGFGCDARTDSTGSPITAPVPTGDWTRSDGGQGGFGLIQLQEGSLDGIPFVQQGAFLFARQRTIIKLGPWNGFSGVNNKQGEHPKLPGAPFPDELRFIDMLHYREATYGTTKGSWLLLNGSDPPIIDTSVAALADYQRDTPMIDHFGRRVVKDPDPSKMMKTYAGYDPVTFVENNAGPGLPPGTTFGPGDSTPLAIYLKEPDGTAFKEKDANNVETAEYDRRFTIDRLPVVSPALTPPNFGTVSRGTSVWLDYNGVALRPRNAAGVAPPFFEGMKGTYNALVGLVPPGQDGQVIVAGVVPQVPGSTTAHYVAGAVPDIGGLCGQGLAPTNDLRVSIPEYSLQDALSDNARITVLFQGAFPVRAGSRVPDPDSLSTWHSDLRELSGYPLVRFQIAFDLGANLAAFPPGPNSLRPAVDEIRLRAEY